MFNAPLLQRLWKSSWTERNSGNPDSGAVKLNNLAFCERSMKLSGFVLDDLSFNLRCGGILSLNSEVN